MPEDGRPRVFGIRRVLIIPDGEKALPYSAIVGIEELQRQVLRINQRYLSEVVEAMGFCPWADTVRDGQGLRRVVLLRSDVGESLRDETAAVVEEIAAAPDIAIGLLIFPNVQVANADFRRFVSSLETAHAGQHARDAIPLAMASFHPEAQADTESPARLVPFIRRSPDPTIQLVRRSAMDKVRQTKNEGSVFVDNIASLMPMMGSRPKASVSDGIAKANLRTVERVGVDEIERILADIKRDRDSSYARAREQG